MRMDLLPAKKSRTHEKLGLQRPKPLRRLQTHLRTPKHRPKIRKLKPNDRAKPRTLEKKIHVQIL